MSTQAQGIVAKEHTKPLSAKLEYVEQLMDYISENKLSNAKAAEFFCVSKQYIDDLFTNNWTTIPFNVLNNMLNMINPPETIEPTEEDIKRTNLQKSIKEGLDMLGMSLYTFADIYGRGHKHVKKAYEGDIQGITTKWLEEVAKDIQEILHPEEVVYPEAQPIYVYDKTVEVVGFNHQVFSNYLIVCLLVSIFIAVLVN